MILEKLHDNGKLSVILDRPLCIYSKDINWSSNCWDLSINAELNTKNIDESYGLDVVERNDRVDVYIPRNAKCTLRKARDLAIDCTVIYKNIECDLTFDSDDSIDDYFMIE